jgi:hypothetical protein
MVNRKVGWVWECLFRLVFFENAEEPTSYEETDGFPSLPRYSPCLHIFDKRATNRNGAFCAASASIHSPSDEPPASFVLAAKILVTAVALELNFMWLGYRHFDHLRSQRSTCTEYTLSFRRAATGPRAELLMVGLLALWPRSTLSTCRKLTT